MSAEEWTGFLKWGKWIETVEDPLSHFYLERVRLYPFIIPVQLQQGLISTYDDHAWRDKFVTYTLGLKQTCQMWRTKFYIKERLRGSLLHICVLKITLWGTLNNSYKKKKRLFVFNLTTLNFTKWNNPTTTAPKSQQSFNDSCYMENRNISQQVPLPQMTSNASTVSSQF